MAFELVTGYPASGKKEHLKKKIIESLKAERKPEEILVLTNSAAAADEIRSSVIEHLGSFSELWIETVSSFCKKILRGNSTAAGIRPGFKVISDFEKRLIIRTLLKRELDLSYFVSGPCEDGLVREISNFIDTAKRNPGWKENIKKTGKTDNPKYRDLILISEMYQQLLNLSNYLDFVDLSIYTRSLISNNPGLLGFMEIFSYQTEDMDTIAADIIMLLSAEAEQVIVSIDRTSSIYSFRGAQPDYFISEFKKKFDTPETHLNPDKPPVTESLIEKKTRYEQAEAVATHIACRIRSGISPGDIALISRSVGEDLSVFTDALRNRGINYLLEGGIGFFKHYEIVEFMSFLNVIHETYSTSDSQLSRTLLLTGTFSEEELNILREVSYKSGYSLAHTLEQERKAAYRSFMDTISSLKKRASEEPADAFIYFIMDEYKFIKRASLNELCATLYGYFFQIVKEYASHYENLNKKKLYFNEFMENIYELLSSFGKDIDIPFVLSQKAVRIMTVQQSKGRTFKTAYLVDMTDEDFPRPYSENPLISTEDHITLGIFPVPGIEQQYESEKRLFEVARTRAEYETVFSRYSISASGALVSASQFISDREPESAEHEISEALIDEKDLLIRIFENTDLILNNGLLSGVTGDRLNRINRLTAGRYEDISDKVTAAIPGVFSSSMLECFSDCPEKFFMRYILGISEPQQPASMLGNGVHRILYKLHSDQTGPGRENDINKLIDDVWKELRFYSEFESRNLRRTAVRMIENYLSILDTETFEVLSCENDFKTSYNGKDIKGRIDRTDRLADKEIRVVDYKSGKAAKMEKALLSAVEKGRNYQIPVYWWATACRYMMIYWLRKEPDKMTALLDFEDNNVLETMKSAETNFRKMTALIEEGLFSQDPLEVNNCRNCNFRKICN
ncbi:MAG: ATP-dependent DNA helicase [Elusimicrobiota bacterium]